LLNSWRDSEGQRFVAFLYANRSPNGILLWDELESLQAENLHLLVIYCCDHADESWTGFVDREMEKKYFPNNVNLLVCDPPSMVHHLTGKYRLEGELGHVKKLSGVLRNYGFQAANVYLLE
jgi:NAD(P)H-flavin reductase